MTVETEISTPVENDVVDTSETVELSNDTSIDEPANQDVTAEIEVENGNDIQEGENQPPQPTEPVLYAGKYKTIEELEKGYKEVQGSFTKAQEYEKKYNDLLKIQQEQYEKAQRELLHQARSRGFNSIEEQDISDKVLASELELYAQNLNLVHPDYIETAKQYLQSYYNTGSKAYLDEAKKYFSSEFIEAVALRKNQYEHSLRDEYRAQQAYLREESDRKLADSLREGFGDFLADVKTNVGKAQALKSFCDVGSINSKEDMQVFADIYNQIAKYERDLAIKEYEAAKAIEATKRKAVIDGGAVAQAGGGLKDSYTAAEIGAMSLEEYNALCDKYGEAEIDKRII